MNILILRVSSIGDVIHTLPALFLIKHFFPKARIGWVVQQKAASLLEKQPFLENIFILPNNFLSPKNWLQTFKVLKQIRKTRWDAVLDFQGLIKTSIISFFFKGPKYGFDFNNSRSRITACFTNFHTKPEYTNIIQKNLSLASSMLQHKVADKIQACPSLFSLQQSFYLKIPQKGKALIQDWLNKNKIKKFISLAPNTTWESKHWPQENWEKLLETLLKNPFISNNYSIILIGKDFGNQTQNIANFIQKKGLQIHLAPALNLITTTYLISQGNLLIAPDTGLLHIADFLGKKTIGIFGPTNAKKHGPFLTTENIKNTMQIECPHFYQKTHGASKQNNQKASVSTNCMYKLSPESLFNKILKILS